jgi:MIP family channel proteins
MDTTLRRGLVAELLGTFVVVYCSAGAVIANYLPVAAGSQPGNHPLHALQPGLVGVAVAQGLIFAAALAVTVRLSGGFLNPAVTLMLWVFNRLDNQRTGLFLAAQLVGALLAGTCLRYTFEDSVLLESHVGTPHLNPLAFPSGPQTASVVAGTSVELILTFFLVFAIFGASRDAAEPDRGALPAGLMLTAGTMVAGPLTGAAANPARWFGTVVWEQLLPQHAAPWADTFVYLAGPILGALAAGLITFRFLFEQPEVGNPSVAVTAKPSAVVAKRK